MTLPFSAPVLPELGALLPALQRQGYAVLGAEQVAQWVGQPLSVLLDWQAYWDDLPPDTYLRDGGRYRYRRHSCFVVDGPALAQAPHRPHWQPLDYNALHGGMQRHFAPMHSALTQASAWASVMHALARTADQLKGAQPWFIEAHQFRIDTAQGIGRPTPEGAHRDGVDLVAVFLVQRRHVKGGETRVFEAAGPNGQRFTLEDPWSLLLLDDARVIHESTPIQPLAQPAYRDTLVVTLRAGGFQDDVARPAPDSSAF